MEIENIGLVDLSKAQELEVATRLFPQPSTMEMVIS
jgi:hypothetical protein